MLARRFAVCFSAPTFVSFAGYKRTRPTKIKYSYTDTRKKKVPSFVLSKKTTDKNPKTRNSE